MFFYDLTSRLTKIEYGRYARHEKTQHPVGLYTNLPVCDASLLRICGAPLPPDHLGAES
jgi:hypothetical protein